MRIRLFFFIAMLLLSISYNLAALAGPTAHKAQDGEVKIKGIAWVDYGSNNVNTSRKFFEETLGLKTLETGEKDGLAVLELPSKQHFEIIGKNNEWHKYLKHPVTAFEVDDVPATRTLLEKKGVKFKSEIASDGGYQWTFFEGPEGYLFEIISRPKE